MAEHVRVRVSATGGTLVAFSTGAWGGKGGKGGGGSRLGSRLHHASMHRASMHRASMRVMPPCSAVQKSKLGCGACKPEHAAPPSSRLHAARCMLLLLLLLHAACRPEPSK